MFSISDGWIPLVYSCLFVLHSKMGIHDKVGQNILIN